MKYKQYYNSGMLRQFDNGHCQSLTVKMKWKDGDDQLQAHWRVKMADARDDGDDLNEQEAAEAIAKQYNLSIEKARKLLLEK